MTSDNLNFIIQNTRFLINLTSVQSKNSYGFKKFPEYLQLQEKSRILEYAACGCILFTETLPKKSFSTLNSKFSLPVIEIPRGINKSDFCLEYISNNLNIEGPLGKKSFNLDLEIFDINIDQGKSFSIKPKNINQNTKRLWGMNRSLLNNAIIGITTGYNKTLELSGVGYRAALKGKQLNLQLGFSHDINFDIPDTVKIQVEKQNIIKISGSDKQEVGSIASKIKSLRPPEPYKGKGIKEQGQYILRKEGKKK